MRRTAVVITGLALSAATLSAAPARGPAPGLDLAATVPESEWLPVNPFLASLRRAGVDVPRAVLPAAEPAHVPQIRFVSVSPEQRPPQFSFRLRQQQQDAPTISGLLASLPAGDRLLRIGADRFSTDDGGIPDAFSIDYRLSSRASLEIIPGDQTPMKLPVTTIGNNEGVAFGVVFRLGSR